MTPKRILVIEDDPEIREVMQVYFEQKIIKHPEKKLSFEYVECIEKARSKLTSEISKINYDLLIVDVRLPNSYEDWKKLYSNEEYGEPLVEERENLILELADLTSDGWGPVSEQKSEEENKIRKSIYKKNEEIAGLIETDGGINLIIDIAKKYKKPLCIPIIFVSARRRDVFSEYLINDIIGEEFYKRIEKPAEPNTIWEFVVRSINIT